MIQNIKWMAVALIVTAVVSCEKEKPQKQSTAISTKQEMHNPTAEAIMNSKTISAFFPQCSMGHEVDCSPGGFSCTIVCAGVVFNQTTVPIRFYRPTVTGQGQTGTQMVVEFLGNAPGIENGLLGPEEWSGSTIPASQQLCSALDYSAINVINREYTAVFNSEHPYGYVVYDCTVKR